MKTGSKITLGDTASKPHTMGQVNQLGSAGSAIAIAGSDSEFGVKSSMNRFFADRNKTFWTFQTLGWLGYIFVRIFHNFTVLDDVGEIAIILPTILSAALIGILMTLFMRVIYRRIRSLNLGLLFAAVILTCAIFGLTFSFIEVGIGPYIVPDAYVTQGWARFGNAMFEATVLFAWSSIYFGYHYYMSFLEQQERALKATAMAHQAQLTMLRYQLNPHFLFNTLNAISTLVLEKAVDDANMMLTKLSSFLRYTLVNQPTQRISLEQELQATKLYLDIETVRFGDRLKIDLDIDDAAKNALVPSLILQPLVENAIKYAIAPEIDGGTITICAKLQDKQLVLTLKDTGPGLADLNNIVSQSGSGVGIVNTKERLKQLYGDGHEFRLENLEPTGLGIFITLPAERSNRAVY